MKVRMKTTAAGPNGVYEADKVYNVGRAQAREWVDNGFAEEVTPDAEVTTVEASETTTRQRGPRRAKAAD